MTKLLIKLQIRYTVYSRVQTYEFLLHEPVIITNPPSIHSTMFNNESTYNYIYLSILFYSEELLYFQEKFLPDVKKEQKR